MCKKYLLFAFSCCCIIVICISIIQRKDTLITIKSSFIMLNQQKPIQEVNTDNNIIIQSNLIKNIEISAHASALVAKDSTLMMLFYAGTQEGARDVKIYQSFLDLNTNKEWKNTRVLLTTKQLSKFSGRFIKKLGNPIVFKDSNNKVHLFVVGVSLGGWATSRIYQFYFDNTLKKIHYVRELKLSPFANYSNLVRTHALALNDGGFYLPIAHEMWHKFPLILYFDSKSNMILSKKINNLKAQLQPSIAQINNKECVALFRTNNRYNTNTYFQTCNNYGNEWGKIITSNIHNHDSSIVLINIGNEVILIHNDGKYNPIFKEKNIRAGDRQAISIYWLKDKQRGIFEYLTTIDIKENDNKKQSTEVSYPSVAIDNNNNLHIAYTYERKTIKHVVIKISSILSLIKTKTGNNNDRN